MAYFNLCRFPRKKFNVILLFTFLSILFTSIFLLYKYYSLDLTNTNINSFSKIYKNTKDQDFIDDDHEIFMQISDIHISSQESSYWDRVKLPGAPIGALQPFSREKDFVDILRYAKDVIRPRVLLVTGDLVHATGVDNKYSRQYKNEWEIYW